MTDTLEIHHGIGETLRRKSNYASSIIAMREFNLLKKFFNSITFVLPRIFNYSHVIIVFIVIILISTKHRQNIIIVGYIDRV